LVTLLVNVEKANSTIHDLSDQVLNNAQAINTSYQRMMNSRLTRPSVGYGLGLVGILLLVGILYLYVLGGDARRAAQMQLETNERNQQAILRLLDELGSLADGDLTVQVTVTEDITGAIADSINYALEAHQATGRILARDRRHRGTHQRHRRTDEPPGTQRRDPGLHGR
jgi:twitching motility protein PilJ